MYLKADCSILTFINTLYVQLQIGLDFNRIFQYDYLNKCIIFTILLLSIRNYTLKHSSNSLFPLSITVYRKRIIYYETEG